MASKQLGKLRQWAGEVISSKDKTTVTEEFRELERDIELRRDGVQQLHLASEAYHHALSKKKDSEAVEDAEKLLPIDALGIVMITHGEQYGEESAFGTSLVKFGRAHCKVATLQEAYALTLQDTFLSSLQHTHEDIKDYEHQRKKLESRRLSFDAAMTKLEKIKSSKKPKEKDLKEAEEELQKARLRYEETSEDVQARMHSIQENEIQQLRDLTEFLDVEMNFVEQYLEVLKDAKANWFDESSLKHIDIPRPTGPSHSFSRNADESKFNSVRSHKSAISNRSRTKSIHDSDEAADSERPSKRRPEHQRSDSASTTKPPSRPSSRTSRKRSDSSATAGGDDKKEKNDKASKRMSVAGWASSLTGRGKKDKDKFAALQDDDDSDASGEDNADDIPRPPSSRSFTYKKSPKPKSKSANSSPSIPARILKPPSLQGKKFVRAIYDFTGSSDELSFKAGDEIVVLNEVLDDWWMGELGGKKGLFPTTYTEVVASSRPPLPSRPSTLNSSNSSVDTASKHKLANTKVNEHDSTDEEHPFGDHHLAATRSPLYGHFDRGSITSSAAEETDDDEEEKRLVPTKKEDDDDYSPVMTSTRQQTWHRTITPRRSAPDVKSEATARKAPPPPPPRRSTNNLLTATVPERKNNTRSHSVSSLSRPSMTPTNGYDTSPFESTTDFANTGCKDFKQNPFKPKGMCSNCFQVHT